MKTIILAILFLLEINFGLSLLLPKVMILMQGSNPHLSLATYWLFLVFAGCLKVGIYFKVSNLQDLLKRGCKIDSSLKLFIFIQLILTITTLASLI